MATAKKTPSGKWQIQACRTVDGKKQRKLFTADTKKEAEYNATQWINDTFAMNNDGLSLSEAYTKYIAAKENVLSPATIRSYNAIKRTHLQDLMPIKVDALNDAKIQSSINYMSASSSPKTVRNAYNLLSSVLKMFRPSYIPKVQLPQKQKYEIVIPTDEQIKNILFCAKNTAFYIPIMLAAFGGMRRAEICALEMDDINGNIISVNKEIVCDSNGVWVKKPPKSFSGNRNIEMPPFVINAIKEKETIYNGTPHALTKGFDKLLRRNNLPDFRFHDLRHYYVSYLFDMNVPEKYIIAQVGHSSSSITRRVYDHLQSKKQTEYGEKIANAFKNFL